MSNYSIWVLEYANCPTQPVGTVFMLKNNAGIMHLPFSYVVIKRGQSIAMVDVGYDYDDAHRATVDRFEVVNWQSPKTVLAKIGLTPDDIQHVFITHAHYDHMGNLHSFPNAHFYVQRDELAGWMDVLSLPKRYDWLKIPLQPEDMIEAISLVAEGRMSLVEGARRNVIPDVDLYPIFQAHTFASQIVVIHNQNGGLAEDWVVAGDSAYTQENIVGANSDGMMYPIGIFLGTPMNILKSYDTMLEKANGEISRIIFGHDQNLWTQYPSWETADGLHVAEICLADGDSSQRPSR